MSPLYLIVRFLPKSNPRHRHIHRRSFTDGTIKWVRDRGLDHAVEREKNLKPMVNIKNFIKSEPSKSIPISIITQKRETLKIRTRPIDFIRKYPSIFEEFLPGGIGIQPHIRLTPEVLDLDSEEQLMYESDSYKQQVADRLLKLLMLCRTNKIPLPIIERLKWDLGLPQNYEKSIIPEFPDYFRLVGAKSSYGSEANRVLELVCWIDDLATSVVEKKAMKVDSGYSKGMPIAFPVQYSTGFEMDTKFKKWVDEWQKLPYISPYENTAHLPPKSEESDKFAVAVLHEFLHILVPKKIERDDVLFFGEYLGIRSRFKRAILHHPGIFYLSSKNRTYTLMLREGYKRGLLVEDHPFMNMRSKYIHLMNTMKESKAITAPTPAGGEDSQKKKQTTVEAKGEVDEEVGESEEESEGELFDSSDAEEDEHDRKSGYGEDDAYNRGRTRRTKLEKRHGRNSERGRSARKHSEGEFIDSSDAEGDKHEGKLGFGKDDANKRRRTRRTNLDLKGHVRNSERGRSARKHPEEEFVDSSNAEGNKHEGKLGFGKDDANKRRRTRRTNLDLKGHVRNSERGRSARKHPEGESFDSTDAEGDKSDRKSGFRKDDANDRRRTRRTNLDVKGNVRNSERGWSAGNHPGKTGQNAPPRSTSRGRSDSSKSRGRSVSH
ncbi:hypothetical protein UlMin_034707 [Ulmus minor]